jgi:DNA-binding transcriptional LysR family regulator
MTFKQFEVFATVVRHMNYTKAAQALGSSQPTLSKQIRSLEKHYKLKLFKKNGKGIEITPEGQDFLSHIEPLLSQLKKIDGKYLNGADKQNRRAPQLKIGATFGAASAILPAPLAIFKRTQQTARITVKANTTAIIERMILKGELELALCPRRPRSVELAAEDYLALRVIVFTHAHDPITKKNNLKAADIASLPLIVRSDTSHKDGGTGLFLRTLREQGYTPNIVMRCESPDALKEAVRQRLGAGILYYENLRDGIEQGTFKQLHVPDMKVEGRIHILYHKRRPLSSNAQEFLKILRRNRDAAAPARPKAVTRLVVARRLAPAPTTTKDEVITAIRSHSGIA